VNSARLQGFVPAKLTNRERKPNLWCHFHDIRRGAPGVPRAFDALNCTERRHPYLHGIAGSHRTEFLQEIAHCGSNLGCVSRPNCSNCCNSYVSLNSSSHKSSMPFAANPQTYRQNLANDE
jgi:hypothetical protein